MRRATTFRVSAVMKRCETHNSSWCRFQYLSASRYWFAARISRAAVPPSACPVVAMASSVATDGFDRDAATGRRDSPFCLDGALEEGPILHALRSFER
jgi:hypothetical protein